MRINYIGHTKSIQKSFKLALYVSGMIVKKYINFIYIINLLILICITQNNVSYRKANFNRKLIFQYRIEILQAQVSSL